MSLLKIQSVICRLLLAQTIDPTVQTPSTFFGYMWDVVGTFFVSAGMFICRGIYFLCKWLMAFTDFLQYFIQKLIGLDYWLNNNSYTLSGAVKNDIIFSFLYNDTVQKTFRAMVGIFIVLLIIFTIYAIIKSEWTYITGEEFGRGTNSKNKIIQLSLKAIVVVIMFPVVLIIGVISSNAILASLVKALNIDTGSTFGQQIFSVATQNANRYRNYAKADARQAVSDTVTFYIDAKEEYISLNNYSNYSDYLKAINATDTDCYTVNTMFDIVNPMKETNFYGYCVMVSTEEFGNLFYFVKVSGTSQQTAYYYYLTKVLGVQVMTPSNGKSLNSSLYSAIKGRMNSTGWLSKLDLNDKADDSDEVKQACYNTLGYFSVYSQTHSFAESASYIRVPDTTSLGFGIDTSAKIMYNSSQISSYFDGGERGVVQLQNEYYVASDVVDFLSTRDISLYIMNVNSKMITWNYSGYSIDSKYVDITTTTTSTDGTITTTDGSSLKWYYTNQGGFSTTKGNNVPNIECVTPILVQYSDLANDQESGNVLYLADGTFNTELYGAVFIYCIKVQEGTTTKYIPLLNRKTFTDPVTGGTFTFSSDYYTSNYRGLVIARGIMDTSNTNAYNGNPTYISASNSVTSKNGTSIDTTTPYYYYMEKTGTITQGVTVETLKKTEYSTYSLSIDSSLNGDADDYKFHLSNENLSYYYLTSTPDDDGNENYVTDLTNLMSSIVVTLGNNSAIAMWTGDSLSVGDYTYYLFSTDYDGSGFEGEYFLVGTSTNNGKTEIYVLSYNNTTVGNASPLITATQSYTLKYKYEESSTIATKTEGTSDTLTAGAFTYTGDGVFSTKFKCESFDNKYEYYSIICTETDAKNNGSLVWIGSNGVVNFATAFAKTDDLPSKAYCTFYLYNFYSAAVISDTNYTLYEYDPVKEEMKRANVPFYGAAYFDDDFVFTILVDDFSNWKSGSSSLGLYNGSNYVAQIYKNSDSIINNVDELIKGSVSILYNGSTYYNILSQNLYSSVDDALNYYKTLSTSFYIQFQLSCVTSAGTYIDFGFDWFKFRFNLVLVPYKVSHNTTIATNFKISDGISFDYFFDDAIKLQDFYLPGRISYWVIFIACLIIIKVLMKAIWGVIKRFYEITLYYIAMPAVAAYYPIDESKFNTQIQQPLIKKVLSTYGVILGLNVFFVLLTPVKEISQIFTAEDIATSGSYFLTHLPITAGMLNMYVYVMFMLVAFTMIEDLPTLVSGIVGADDIVAEGKKARDKSKEQRKDVGDVWSGQKAVDAAHSVADKVKKVPALGKIPGAVINKFRNRDKNGKTPEEKGKEEAEKTIENQNSHGGAGEGGAAGQESHRADEATQEDVARDTGLDQKQVQEMGSEAEMAAVEASQIASGKMTEAQKAENAKNQYNRQNTNVNAGAAGEVVREMASGAVGGEKGVETAERIAGRAVANAGGAKNVINNMDEASQKAMFEAAGMGQEYEQAQASGKTDDMNNLKSQLVEKINKGDINQGMAAAILSAKDNKGNAMISDSDVQTAATQTGDSGRIKTALSNNLALAATTSDDQTKDKVLKAAVADEGIRNEAVLQTIQDSKDKKVKNELNKMLSKAGFKETDIDDPEKRQAIAKYVASQAGNNKTIDKFIGKNQNELAENTLKVAQQEAIKGNFKVTAWDSALEEDKDRVIADYNAKVDNIQNNSILNGADEESKTKIMANATKNLISENPNSEFANGLKQKVLSGAVTDEDVKKIDPEAIKKITGREDASAENITEEERAMLGFAKRKLGSVENITADKADTIRYAYKSAAEQEKVMSSFSDEEIAGIVNSDKTLSKKIETYATADTSLALSKDQLAEAQAKYAMDADSFDGVNDSTRQKLVELYNAGGKINDFGTDEQEMTEFFKNNAEAQRIMKEHMAADGEIDYTKFANKSHIGELELTDDQKETAIKLSEEELKGGNKNAALLNTFINTNMDGKDTIVEEMLLKNAGFEVDENGNAKGQAAQDVIADLKNDHIDVEAIGNDRDVLVAYERAKLLGKTVDANGKDLKGEALAAAINSVSSTELMNDPEKLNEINNAAVLEIANHGGKNSFDAIDILTSDKSTVVSDAQREALLGEGAKNGYAALNKDDQTALLTKMATGNADIENAAKRQAWLKQQKVSHQDKVIEAISNEKFRQAFTKKTGLDFNYASEEQLQQFYNEFSKDKSNADTIREIENNAKIKNMSVSKGKVNAGKFAGRDFDSLNAQEKQELLDEAAAGEKADIGAYLNSEAGKKDRENLEAQAKRKSYTEIKGMLGGEKSENIRDRIIDRNVKDNFIEEHARASADLIESDQVLEHMSSSDSETSKKTRSNFISRMFGGAGGYAGNGQTDELGAGSITEEDSAVIKRQAAIEAFKKDHKSEYDEIKKQLGAGATDDKILSEALDEAHDPNHILSDQLNEAGDKAVLEEEEKRFVLGLGGQSTVVADHVRENNQKLYDKIKKQYNQSNSSGVEFDKLDKTEQDKIIAEGFNKNATSFEKQQANEEYAKSLITSKAVNIGTLSQDDAIDAIVNGAKNAGMNIDSWLRQQEGSGSGISLENIDKIKDSTGAEKTGDELNKEVMKTFKDNVNVEKSKSKDGKSATFDKIFNDLSSDLDEKTIADEKHQIAKEHAESAVSSDEYKDYIEARKNTKTLGNNKKEDRKRKRELGNEIMAKALNMAGVHVEIQNTGDETLTHLQAAAATHGVTVDDFLKNEDQRNLYLKNDVDFASLQQNAKKQNVTVEWLLSQNTAFLKNQTRAYIAKDIENLSDDKKTELLNGKSSFADMSEFDLAAATLNMEGKMIQDGSTGQYRAYTAEDIDIKKHSKYITSARDGIKKGTDTFKTYHPELETAAQRRLLKYSELPDESKMSKDERDAFNINKGWLMQDIRNGGDEDQILSNIFKNTRLVNDDKITNDMLVMEAEKIIEKENISGFDLNNIEAVRKLVYANSQSNVGVSNWKNVDENDIKDTQSFKQLITSDTVNAYLNKHENLKDTYVGLGAQNMTLALDKKTQEEKNLEAVEHNNILKNQVAIQALNNEFDKNKIKQMIVEMLKAQGKTQAEAENMADKDYDKLSQQVAINQYFNQDGTVKNKQQQQVKQAINNLSLTNQNFENSLYKEVTKVVDPSRNATPEQRRQFFENSQIQQGATHIDTVGKSLKKGFKNIHDQTKAFFDKNDSVGKVLGATVGAGAKAMGDAIASGAVRTAQSAIFKITKKLPKEAESYTKWNRSLQKQIERIKTGQGEFKNLSAEERQTKIKELQSQIIYTGNNLPKEFSKMSAEERLKFKETQTKLKKEAFYNKNYEFLNAKTSRTSKTSLSSKVADSIGKTFHISGKMASEGLKNEHKQDLANMKALITEYNSKKATGSIDFKSRDKLEQICKQYFGDKKGSAFFDKYKGATDKALKKAFEAELARQYKVASNRVARDSGVKRKSFFEERVVGEQVVRYKRFAKSSNIDSFIAGVENKGVDSNHRVIPVAKGNMFGRKTAKKNATAKAKMENVEIEMKRFEDFCRGFRGTPAEFKAAIEKDFGPIANKVYNRSGLGNLRELSGTTPVEVQKRVIAKHLTKVMEKQQKRIKYNSNIIPADASATMLLNGKTFTNAKSKHQIEIDRQIAADFNKALTTVMTQRDVLSYDALEKKLSPHLLQKFKADLSGLTDDQKFDKLEQYLKKQAERVSNRINKNQFMKGDKQNLEKLNGIYFNKRETRVGSNSATMRNLVLESDERYRTLVKVYQQNNSRYLAERQKKEQFTADIERLKNGPQNRKIKNQIANLESALKDSNIKLNVLKQALDQSLNRKLHFERQFAQREIAKAKQAATSQMFGASHINVHDVYKFKFKDGTSVDPSSVVGKEIESATSKFVSEYKSAIQRLERELRSSNSKLAEDFKNKLRKLSNDFGENLGSCNSTVKTLKDQLKLLSNSSKAEDVKLAEILKQNINRISNIDTLLKNAFRNRNIDMKSTTKK